MTKLQTACLSIALPVCVVAQSAGTASTTIAPASVSANGVYTPLTPEQKIKRRALRLIEPVTLVSSAMGAGIDQWRNVPQHWGQGYEAYAIRFASSEGYTAAHNSVALGFDLAFHLDPRYRSMPEGTFKARLWNAVSQSVIAYKDSGGRTVNVSEIAGNFGAGFIANSWQPPGDGTVGDGLTRGAMGLAFHTGKNVAREFLPDILHRRH